MRTLDRWRNTLAKIPSTIECPKMRILARDHEPPVFVGPGHIDISDLNKLTFRMFASAPNLGHALSSILRASENRYEVLDQFRLFATDYEGRERGCGWIEPQFEEETGESWLVSGTLASLMTRVSSSWIAPKQSIELLFQPAPDVRLTESLLTVSSIEAEEVSRSWHPAKHSLKSLGTTITFYKEPPDDALWVTAPTSQMLPHPYAENWLGEPLRILMGQLIYPRLVSRNIGDGSALIQLRSSHKRLRNTGWISLMANIPISKDEQFWQSYSDLLTMIASSRDNQGLLNFEANPVTRFYEEIIQATQGSRWVQSMTLANSAEGLAKLLMTSNDKAPEFPKDDVNGLRSLIEAWDGCEQLKKRVIGWFPRFGETSVPAFLRDLQRKGQLLPDQTESWTKVRNAVMHGNLTSPWSTEEADSRLRSLVGLVHRLTRLLLERPI